jgi:uncharacterized membrane protein YqgA involved in biofilm formation
VIIVGIGLVILEIRRIRGGALLPALVVSVVVALLAPHVGAPARALGR